MGADELRDDTTPVDITHQHDRHVGGGGEPHIGNVARTQIDLGGRACALDNHQIMCGAETLETLP